MDVKQARGSKDTMGKFVYAGRSTQLATRKSQVLSEDRPGINPYNGPRNSLVWTSKQSHASAEDRPRKRPNCDRTNSVVSSSRDSESKCNNAPKTQRRVCKFWISGKCLKGEKCRFLHSWFHGQGFAMLATLEGHKKPFQVSD